MKLHGKLPNWPILTDPLKDFENRHVTPLPDHECLIQIYHCDKEWPVWTTNLFTWTPATKSERKGTTYFGTAKGAGYTLHAYSDRNDDFVYYKLFNS